MIEKDPYAMLGLSYGAPMSEVKKRYKDLATYYHPDRNPGDERAAEKMKEYNAAYTAIKTHDYYSEEHYYPERAKAQPFEPFQAQPNPEQPQANANSQPQYQSYQQPQQNPQYPPQYGGGADAATQAGQQGGMPNGFYDQQGKFHEYDPNQGATQAEQQKAWEDAVYRDQKEQEKKAKQKLIVHDLLSRVLPVVLAAIVLIVAISILHNHTVQKNINKAVLGSSQAACITFPQDRIPSSFSLSA